METLKEKVESTIKTETAGWDDTSELHRADDKAIEDENKLLKENDDDDGACSRKYEEWEGVGLRDASI